MLSRFLSAVLTIATSPVALAAVNVAFTPHPSRVSFFAATNGKIRACARPSPKLNSRNHDDLVDNPPHLQTRNELLRRGINALTTAATVGISFIAGSSFSAGATEITAAGEEPEITSKGFVELSVTVSTSTVKRHRVNPECIRSRNCIPMTFTTEGHTGNVSLVLKGARITVVPWVLPFQVRIMEPLNEANGYSSKNAFRGRLVFGLYGRACPKAVANFLRYAGGRLTNGEPSYSDGLLTKMEPGVLLEGGKIAGLNTIRIGGQEELEYNGEVIPVPPLLENASVKLSHDRRGLLTRDRLSQGPEFGVTLAPARDLDGGHEVFGRLLQGEDVLSRLEKVPVYSGGSLLLEEGSVASNALKAQNRALVYIGKNIFKDERAVDRTGSLMRRVDIVDCGVL